VHLISRLKEGKCDDLDFGQFWDCHDRELQQSSQPDACDKAPLSKARPWARECLGMIQQPKPRRIAILAWGSLMWRVAGLRVRGRWRDDGPILPLEFSGDSAVVELT
jgi:hypothetical protein